jgi:ATP-dependent helicase HrpA
VLNSLKQELDKCQLSDSYRLARQIRKLENSQLSKSEFKSRLDRIAGDIATSQQLCDKRARAIPADFNFPSELPVSDKAIDIGQLLVKHQVLVIAGDTGSGKTTQIPKICLQAGFGRRGIIGHTQPRRLATVSVANRIAEELETKLGSGVGYQIRFNETVSESTYLKLMTDGILLAEIQNDKFLNKYDVIIIDEAHERSLNIDFLLGFLKQLLKKRIDLKLIITSATIDVEKFSKHFSNAPIVSVSGRTYPVETRYFPLENQSDESTDQLQLNGILQALEKIATDDAKQKQLSGDVLIFFSSEREIRETAVAIRKRKFPHCEVLPLYARLRQSEQRKIFSEHRGRRIVLATNVAETSITVPGIRYVIDTGFARISRYSVQSKIQRLPIEAISQASANQRQGRCGRVSEGVCIRLYSEQDFNGRTDYTDPEIKRTNLASVILRMLSLGLGDVEDFPYLEPPEQKAINDGFKLLNELNAINQKRELTAIGKQMAKLPVDPKLSRMLVVANTQACLYEVLIIVSALSIQDPRELSGDFKQQAQERLAVFNHQDSDFLSLVNLWKDYEQKRQDMTQNQLKKHCKSHFLSFMRMREWREVHRQLLLSCQQLGFRLNKEPGTYEAVHRTLIAGSLNQIGNKLDGKNFLGSRNRRFTLFGSSVVTSTKANWIVTGELIETSQTFASMAAKIQPQWVESMALHLVKREYFEPHWSKKRQAAMAYEKVQLYGLTIIEKSLINFRNVDAEGARAIFINEGLVAGEIVSNHHFVKSNADFLLSLSKEEEKLRRPDFYIGDREIASFYEERIPEEINTTRQLDAWLKSVATTEKDILLMTRENILSGDALNDHAMHFPDHTPIQKNRLVIDYKFDPGSARDGAAVQVPEKILNQLEQADIDWAVPGIVREKCIALLKGLPKSVRKALIPISNLVDEILPNMTSTEGELIDALISQVAIAKQLKLSRSDFQSIELPAHLRVKIQVSNDDGDELDFGEQLSSIKKKLLPVQEQGSLPRAAESIHPLQQQEIKNWEFGDLPERVEIGGDLIMVRYPALVDYEDSVSIELFADQKEARSLNKFGLVRLFMFRSVAQRNMLKKRFEQLQKQCVLLIPPQLKELVPGAITASYLSAFNLDDSQPRDQESFEQLLDSGKSKLHSAGEQIANVLEEFLKARFSLLKNLTALNSDELGYFSEDIKQQLDNLMTEKLLLSTSIEWLKQYPRYLQAIQLRLDRAPHLGAKDKENTQELAKYWRRYEDFCEQRLVKNPEELDRLRWMIEEYRVSLFAQSLGTKLQVSAKRLEKQLKLILD